MDCGMGGIPSILVLGGAGMVFSWATENAGRRRTAAAAQTSCRMVGLFWVAAGEARCHYSALIRQTYRGPGTSNRSTMKVVIAGGSGFLGSPLAWAWAEEGHDVRVLTRGLVA